MLVVRKEQVDALGVGMLKGFENEMVVHLAEFSPPLFNTIKEDQMREVVRLGLKKADRYGFTLRGPMRLYLEMMLLFGSHFDSDPQYPWATEILFDRHSVSQMQRAEWLYDRIVDFQEKVSGPHGANTRNALEALLTFSKNTPEYSSSEFEDSVIREIYRIFPEKAEYLGRTVLSTLVRVSREDAAKYKFPVTRGETVMVVMKFAFGHGCGDDPLYPWIGRTLNDYKIIDSKARLSRLEKKAVTWLEHVLKGSLGEEEI